MSSNAIDAPSGGALSGAQIGFAAGTSAPSNGMIISGAVGIGTLSPSYPPYLLDVSNTGINAAIRAISTTTGSANEGALFLARGDQANGYAQTHYLTGTTQYWTTGLRAPDNNYHIYDTQNSVDRVVVTTGGSLVMNTAALATNATDGFIYESGCAGTPTGTPTAQTGRVALVTDTTNNIGYYYNSGWIPTSGMVLINTQALGASATSVTLSIPANASFHHLMITGMARCDTVGQVQDNIVIQFNGDTVVTNYDYQLLQANGGSINGSAVNANLFAQITASTAPANAAGSFTTTIYEYSNTTFNKSFLTMNGYMTTSGSVAANYIWANVWNNTAAVTNIKLIVATAGRNFIAGSVFRLYGVY